MDEEGPYWGRLQRSRPVPDQWLKEAIESLAANFPPGSLLSWPFMIKAFITVILVGFICGAVGSSVVGNRMAFFSDALAHTAFAGVTLALLMGLFIDAEKDSAFYKFGVPAIMAAFGILVGLGIAYVRERTGMASDTIIGVFFAFSIGIGALLFGWLSSRGYFRIENFLFGDPVHISESSLILIALLCVVTFGFLLLMHNPLIFSSFNPSLASSRNISMRLCNYLFIVLLALIVNICVWAVGALLINGLLLVPAATAGNFCRNIRQMFWTSVALAVGAGVIGLWISFRMHIRVGTDNIYLGASGAIVTLNVLLFFLSMIAASPWCKRLLRQPVS
jgi:zinc transport system permease protein